MVAAARAMLSYFRLNFAVEDAGHDPCFPSPFSLAGALLLAGLPAVRAAAARRSRRMRRRACRSPGRSATASGCSARSAISCSMSRTRVTAASSRPSRRWSCRARAAAGPATWSTGSASTSRAGSASPAPATTSRKTTSHRSTIPSPCAWPARCRSAPPAPGRSTTATGRRPSTFDCAEPINLRVRYGKQTVASVDVSSGSDPTQRVQTEIQVRDIFIAGLGDSVASGEGNPDRPLALSDEGFCFRSYLGAAGAQYYRPSRAGYKGGRACEAPDTLANWQRYSALWFNSACHRSLYSYQTRTALALAVRYTHIAVTYLPLACTGASIADGLLGSQRARECPPGKSGVCQARERARSPSCARRSPRPSNASRTASSIWCCSRSAPTTSISPASSPTSSSTPRPNARCSAAAA